MLSHPSADLELLNSRVASARDSRDNMGPRSTLEDVLRNESLRLMLKYVLGKKIIKLVTLLTTPF